MNSKQRRLLKRYIKRYLIVDIEYVYNKTHGATELFKYIFNANKIGIKYTYEIQRYSLHSGLFSLYFPMIESLFKGSFTRNFRFNYSFYKRVMDIGDFKLTLLTDAHKIINKYYYDDTCFHLYKNLYFSPDGFFEYGKDIGGQFIDVRNIPLSEVIDRVDEKLRRLILFNMDLFMESENAAQNSRI